MLIMDMSDVPSQQLVQVAEVRVSQSKQEKLFGTVGVCVPVPNADHQGREGTMHSLHPQEGAGSIFKLKMPPAIDPVDLSADIEAASVKLLKLPEHGVLEIEGGWNFKYKPNQGFFGNDKITFLVDIGGHSKIKAVYFIKVVNEENNDNVKKFEERYRKYCSPDFWLISSATVRAMLANSGESLYVVKELLRHSSITVTEEYAHLAPSQTAAAVQRLLF